MVQVVVINSLNPKSGKTLLTTHLGVMLAKEYKTAVLDSAGEKSDLAMFVARRYTLNLSQNLNLPIPQYHSLEKNTFEETIAPYDVVILDSPDKKFYAYADVWITPLKGTEGLASVVQKDSLYASLVWQAKKQRASGGKSAFRWVIVPNDAYTPQEAQALAQVGKFLGYQTSPRLETRPEYNEGLKTGLTVLDKDLPVLKTLFELPDMYARRNLKKIAEFIWRNK